MRSTPYALAVAGIAVGLLASACGGSSSDNATVTATTTATVTASSSAPGSTAASTTAASSAPASTTATGASNDLSSLIPEPPNVEQSNGPNNVEGGGIHQHYKVAGAPLDVMNAYKASLESAGWNLTVKRSGGGAGGGGATYVGTNGDAYGAFDGGGHANTTDLNACVWPTKPAKPRGCGSEG